MKPGLPAETAAQEESLDPQDWGALRKLGHRMVDDMMSYLETVRDRPAWQPLPPDAGRSFTSSVPIEPSSPEAVYEEFQRDVLPYPMGNIHPRFWGWVMGTGTPFGALADLLASSMNSNCGGGDHAANQVEFQVIEWCKQMLGMPGEMSGILVSGGSMANFVGLAVARNSNAEIDVGKEGLCAAPRPMTIYASSETHNSVKKSANLLGLGYGGLHEIPVDDDCRIKVEELEKAIAADRAAARHPFCVVGNAGTVNTGAIDDLEALARVCQSERLWFHVDGAFGALAAISDSLRPLVAGLDLADSVAFDLHKWMYMPYEVGCTLVRDPEQHRATFTAPADYLVHANRGTASGDVWFSEYGPQLSRGFRALKVWMSLKEHGVRKYARQIEQNCAQAKYLKSLIEGQEALELMAPVPLNIVCFRYREDGLDDVALDRINQEILFQIQEEGIAVPSSTRLHGKNALRVAITNHRSRREDFDLLVSEVVERGKAIRAQSR